MKRLCFLSGLLWSRHFQFRPARGDGEMLSVNKNEWLEGQLGLSLLLSHFSRVRLCATPEMAAHQAPVPGILQARTLEWVAISFSNAAKWKVKVKSLSRVQFLATPWTAAHQAPPPMRFSKQEYWSGVVLTSKENKQPHTAECLLVLLREMTPWLSS